MKTINIAPLIAIIYSCVQLSVGSVITLENRGYAGILVAIHHSVPEDEQLITNLKALFTKASKFLYSATEERVYFKEITIAVPSNWTWKPEYHIESGNHFSAADVQVDHPNPVYGDAPYTEQPGGCGEPGRYIHLTPRFVKEFDQLTEMYGKPERYVIQKWAQLRYGVFDEYGIPGHRFYPSFYTENKKVRPTICSREIPGWIRSTNGGRCCRQPDGQIRSDCIFVPDVQNKTIKASIMSMPFIPSVDKFCDDRQHANRKHNMRAPTKQNSMCNYESTWSVISRHQDFRNMDYARTPVSYSLTPTFRMIQSPLPDMGRYVLLLDVSRSMKGLRSTLLRQSASRLIEDRIPDGARLGIVQFGGEATTLRSLTVVDSSTRASLSNNLPTETVKGTAIGKGLREAIKVLKEGTTSSHGGLIILVTDGEENVRPYIDQITSEILKERIVINTIAFGSRASEKLEKLTKATGGKAYFFPNLEGMQSSFGLDSAFLESVTVQSDVELQPQRLTDEVFILEDSETIKTVIIDTDLGKDTMFTVTSPYIGQVDVSLRSPTGDVYNSRNPEYNREVHRKDRIEVLLPKSQTGKWVVTFTRHGNLVFPVTLSVSSKAIDPKIQPITVKSWLSDVAMTFPCRLKVFASVRKGFKAVTGATVKATVEGPNGKHQEIVLRDNGADGDATKNDGTYTGYFTRFNSNGRYAVKAQVLNDGNAKLKTGAKDSGSWSVPATRGFFTTEPATEFSFSDLEECGGQTTESAYVDNSGEPVVEFQRESDTGSFLLQQWNPNVGDVIPPAEITDLVVLHSQENYKAHTAEVTLQWTAVGDGLDSNKVTRNELWFSTNMESFIKDPFSGIKIPEENITSGTLKPASPGQIQTITVLVPFNLATEALYFAMRANNQAGNVSPKFNIAPLDISAKKEMLDYRRQWAINEIMRVLETMNCPGI